MLIFGTPSSSWSEIASLIPVSSSYDKKMYEEIKTNSKGEGIDEDLLEKWRKELSFSTRLIFKLVYPDKTKEEESNFSIIDEFLKLLKEIKGQKVYIHFDITHGFRYIPILFSFALFPLLILTQIDAKMMFYYGAFDMRTYYENSEETPVLLIDIPQKMLELYKSLLCLENFGYFPDLVKLLLKQLDHNTGDLYSKIDDLYLKFDFNQPIRFKEQIIKKINTKQKFSIYQESLNYLIEYFKFFEGKLLSERMKQRAIKAKENYNYGTSIILLFEAILILMRYKMRSCGREQVKLKLFSKGNEDYENLKLLRELRNSIAHARESNNPEVKKILTSKETFEEKFNIFLELYKKIENKC